uniref:BESS domain-containing protein n=1 Tax=Echinostoma caproni TaxID=27848 RepID=A0A183B1S6_9TREM
LYAKARSLLDQPQEVIPHRGQFTTIPFTRSSVPSTPFVTSSPVCAQSTPTPMNETAEDLICVSPFVGAPHRRATISNPSSLDEIFRSDLQEPSESDLLHELQQHTYFRALMASTKMEAHSTSE